MSALAFRVPAAGEAHVPPEARGLARDGVRLLVASRSDGEVSHARFRDLPDLLAPGDLLVVNTSATVPAAVLARRDGDGDGDGGGDRGALELRFATAAPDLPAGDWWIVERRSADGSEPLREDAAGERLILPGGARVEIVAPYAAGERLWLAHYEGEPPLGELLARRGHPIRYRHVHGHWPLQAYRTVYARRAGSAEMPSAGRPFTAELVTRLVASGVLVAPLELHAGVSSPERGEPPCPERFEVPAPTARLVGAVRAWGGRVIAVGTTVVRALETVASGDGRVAAGAGWTSHVVTPETGVTAVDGLITGWHEPEASHLQMLEAVAGRELLERSYAAALEHGYLWHEFGDSHLVLP